METIFHPNFHQFFMKRALKLASKAFRKGEVPVGALICRLPKEMRERSLQKNESMGGKSKNELKNGLKKDYRLGDTLMDSSILSSHQDQTIPSDFQNVEIVAEAYNQCESFQSALFHAELLALRRASEKLKKSRLNDCFLYVTLEPCFMCAGALLLSRIQKLIFGAFDLKFGAVGSLYNIFDHPKINHRPQIVQGILAPQCSKIMTDFFKLRRKEKRKTIDRVILT